jgi:hypothetical protein
LQGAMRGAVRQLQRSETACQPRFRQLDGYTLLAELLG